MAWKRLEMEWSRFTCGKTAQAVRTTGGGGKAGRPTRRTARPESNALPR